MQTPEARYLPDGRRLHLNHGPIDLIVEAIGLDRERAMQQAEARFQTLLGELVAELDLLRRPLGDAHPKGAVARRMAKAVAPHCTTFVTPMAAVAGAVADEICAALSSGCDLERAYVNNGGDISLYLTDGQSLTAALNPTTTTDRLRLAADQPARGVATSGWQGRSHSLGIADAVTVIARTAAMADVAATLIANAVDLPGHPGIRRRPACELAPDSDLGEMPGTIAVDNLSHGEIRQALANGKAAAQDMAEKGLIDSAALFLQGQSQIIGSFEKIADPTTNGARNERLQIA